MLTLEDAGFGYGPIGICQEIDLTIESGEVVCLLGRNGMGKTTLLEGLMGMNSYKGGRILFKGEDISNEPTHRRAKRGIGLVPQGRRIFPDITVRDNMRLGSLAHYAKCQPVPEEILNHFPRLRERLDQQAGTLSGGEQQMLAMARALAGKAELLLLDEPSEGLAPLIVEAIGELILELSRKGATILIAEQNLHFALSVASRGYVIEKGRIVESGDANWLKNDTIVQDYLMV